MTGHYLRAERLLTEPLDQIQIPKRSGIVPRSLKGKGKERDDNTGLDNFDDGDRDEDEGNDRDKKGRLIDESLACRYLAAQCLVRLCLFFLFDV